MAKPNMEHKQIICSRCVLPEHFPGIHFNKDGVCSYCLSSRNDETIRRRKGEMLRKFEGLVQEVKGKNDYDALMCYSGGKDSTYTLGVLKEEYGLSVLAVSYDNGFLPQQTMNNIKNVVDQLGVDHLLVKPRFDLLAKIFRFCAANEVYGVKALERSSAICTSCMGIIKYSALRLALEKGIPLVAYGWSPGQAPITSSIMKNNPKMVREMQKTIYEPLFQIAGKGIAPYFLEEKHFDGGYSFPYNVHPMAFLNYDIDDIYKSISRFGWKRPEEVDANSTNCLLNTLGNYVHKKRLGFHPYAFELANLVREGYLERSVALERLSEPDNPEIVADIQQRLGMGKHRP
jgi:tRNA(Ile)-lysidine synthase TilS/MesJ